MSIDEYGTRSVKDALRLVKGGLLTEDELRAYASTPFAPVYSELVVYIVSKIQVARSPISMLTMRERWGYWPSATYTPLADDAKTIVDELGCFE